MRKKLYKWEDVNDFRIEPLIGRARVHIHRADGDVVGPLKSGWKEFRNPIRDVLAISILHNSSASVSVNNTSGTAATLDAVGGGNLFNHRSLTFDFLGRLRWGSNGTAETGDEDNVLTFEEEIQFTNTTLDTTANTFSAQGSKVSGVTATLREVGYSSRMVKTDNGSHFVLVDRTVVPDETVNEDDTVTITYDWAWS